MCRFILDVNDEFGTTIVLIEHDMGVVMDISRPRRRARLRQEDRRRHARRGAQQPRRDQRLPRHEPLKRRTAMGFFLETLIGGLMAGMLYSLVALGFVLIFKASRRLQLRAGRDGAVRGAGDGALRRMDAAAGWASTASCSPTCSPSSLAMVVMIAVAWLIERLVLRQARQPGRHHAADGDARHRLLPRRLRPDAVRQRHLQDRRRHAEGPDVPARERVPGRHPDQQGRPVRRA